MTTPLYRSIATKVRVLDESKRLVEYIASSEALDSYNEIIRVEGWRFNRFARNAPFLDCHKMDSISRVLGKVVEARVEGKQLVEVVQWADEPDTLADWGWRMTKAGFLTAVSVGFLPTRWCTRFDRDAALWVQQLEELGIDPQSGQVPSCIYVEQEQVELSACVVGANPEAVARSYKSGALTDRDLEGMSTFLRKHQAHSPSAPDGAAAEAGTQRSRLALVAEVQRRIAR